MIILCPSSFCFHFLISIFLFQSLISRDGWNGWFGMVSFWRIQVSKSTVDSHGVFLFCITENEKGGKKTTWKCGRYGLSGEIIFIICDVIASGVFIFLFRRFKPIIRISWTGKYSASGDWKRAQKTWCENVVGVGICAENISKLILFFVMCLHQTKVTTVYHTLLWLLNCWFQFWFELLMCILVCIVDLNFIFELLFELFVWIVV